MMNAEHVHRGGTELTEFARSELTGSVLAAAFEVHTLLGPGLLESVYQEALRHELGLRAIPARTQVLVPVHYKGESLASSLRLDLLVADEVVVEVKSVKALEEIHTAQLLTYLRLTGLSTGLLINFNVASLKLGIKRVVNTPRNSANSVPLR
ncbi:MAG TPA: GxxExxY protein [Burkholderiaceae bacterium]|nr:GxxExxY protein [Burkholderiaceae bacterium]